MSSIFSWLKKEIIYIKDSFFEIIKGFVLFILCLSGLASAIFLRYLNYNGITITIISIAIEFVALILCYFIFKVYIKPEKKEEPISSKGKKI